jgi:putative nucleotidyltransferase with HDIG domain
MTTPARPGVDLSRFKKSGDATSAPQSAPAGGPFSVVVKERRIQEILSSVEALPSLPSVVMEVMQLANQEGTKATDFEAVIRKDQALAAKVLKLVNSPFFAVRSKVTSISQAIVVLGFKSLKSLVLAAKTSRLLSRQLTPYGLDAGGSWKHAIGTAAVSRLLAKKAGLGPDAQEELFVAGLLHDVGKIVLAPHISRFQTDFDATLRRNEGNLVQTETELVGISHPDVGGRMARKWKLDPVLESLIQEHHSLESISSETMPLHAVQCANAICHKLGLGLTSGPRPVPSSYEELIQVLEIRQESEELEQEIAALLDEMQGVFQSLSGD